MLNLGARSEVVPVVANGLEQCGELCLVVFDLDIAQLLIVAVRLHLEVQNFEPFSGFRVPLQLFLPFCFNAL